MSVPIKLAVDQRKTLDKWLFEEKHGYEVVWQRAQALFKYQGSKSSVRRYFYRRRKERGVEEFKDLREELAAISEAPANPESLRVASMKLLGTYLFKRLRESPENVKEWAAVASLMVQNDRNEVMREVKAREMELRHKLRAKDQEIRQEAIEFGREKFQFDMIARAVRALPELQRLAAAMNDPDPERYMNNPHWGEAWEAMYPHGIGGQPGGTSTPTENIKQPTANQAETPEPKEKKGNE